MRGNKLLKGLAATLSLMLLVTAVPVVAKETDDAQTADEVSLTSDISETEGILNFEEYSEEVTEYLEDQETEDLEEQIDDSDEENQIMNLDADVDTEPGPEEDDPNIGQEPGPAVEGVVVSPGEVTLNVVGQTTQLAVSTTPDEDTIESTVWKSDNDKVATVDSNGKVTAVANGTATITVKATYDDQTFDDTCMVTVSIYSDGFHKDPDSNDWYYYTNGKVDTGKTDVIKGTVDGTTGWWNVIKGKVTRSETVAENSNGWWYINSNGMVDFSYNGFATNSNGSWYCEDGKVNFDKNSVIKDTTGALGTKGTWYYVVGSKVQSNFTGLADYKNENGWWYIENGQVTFTANTVAENKNGWYYVKDSKVDFSYNGFATNSNGSWYCENGKVNFDKNSVIKDTTGALGTKGTWYYVVGSKVQLSFTGLADYKNENGWWYIENGLVTFSANTVAQNINGWYYIRDSKVDFNYTGFAKGSTDSWYVEDGKATLNKNSVIKDTNGALGTKGTWYYVVGSKVQSSFTGLANYRNENGWYYINNGKVTFDYDGFAQNNNGWYYLEGSKVDFSKNSVIKGTVNGTYDWWYVVGGKVQTGFTGLANYSNENGWWYIKNGQVDFTFNGIGTNNNGSYVVENGKVNFNYNGTYTYGGITYNVTNGKASHPAADVGMDMTMYNKAQSQSSSTKWLIMVDVTNCKLGIFQGSNGNWTPYKYWDCTTGAPGSPTCIGSYTIYGKGVSFGDNDHTCYWYSQFNGNYLIHSVLYYPGTHTVKEGRLGMHLSNGCVRLSYDNAKWVYDNVPYNTRVVTYK